MSDLETEDRKLREDSLSQVEVAKKALHKNPCDTQWLIKCPLALRKLTTDTSSSHEVHESLQDAKTKLEKVLETHQHDHEAKFQLGMVYYHILKSGKYHGTHEEFFKKTIEYFKDVKDMVPEAYNMLDLMKSYLPSKSDEEQDCNVDNLTRQGQKLFWSSCLARDGDEKKKLNKEAIEKFSAALLLEPDDILVKLQLATARMRNCDVRDKDGKAEYEHFLQECCKLEEVLLESSQTMLARLPKSLAQTRLVYLASPRIVLVFRLGSLEIRKARPSSFDSLSSNDPSQAFMSRFGS